MIKFVKIAAPIAMALAVILAMTVFHAASKGTPLAEGSADTRIVLALVLVCVSIACAAISGKDDR